MKTFAQVLSDNHMKFTDFLDDDAVQELEDFWKSLVEGNGGEVADSEIDAVLESYETMGMIAPLDGSVHARPFIPAHEEKKEAEPEEEFRPDLEIRTARPNDYTVLYSDAASASPEHPLLILEDPDHSLPHHITGSFANPERADAFAFNDGKVQKRNITAADSRFRKLIAWLGTGRVCVRLSGVPCEDGYAVTKIRAQDPNGNESLTSANSSFIQLVIKRLQASGPVYPEDEDEKEEDDSSIILSDMPSMVDFMKTAGDTLPPNIRAWAHRNIAMTNSGTISPDEKRHAQRALSMMLNIQWESSYFPSIDPKEARRILDEELYGMDEVKQRVIETIIQINRTHTLPGYGLLLVGPAGTGKSQIAYAVAKILKLPWFALDMSTIHDAEALTGSPRVYTNAKPGRIMEAFSYAGSSNLVFIINELDKADSGNSQSNPADTLLTLLDGLGFTDNYIECTIPTNGVYPIATANDKSRISDPLLTRFAVIDIPDYTVPERKIIFSDYVMPRVLCRLGMEKDECVIRDDGIDAIIARYADLPGVRNLEQAAEHICANALYRIETEGRKQIVYTKEDIEQLLGQ